MPLKTIAIIGRPNVGKSTFFNRLARRRVAIVNDTPGVTRDRIFFETEILPAIPVRITDTGGLEPTTDDYILSQMRTQTLLALQDADLVVMMVDADQGLTAMDQEVADVIRKSGKPAILLANKVDIKKAVHNVHDFHTLGFLEMIPISAAHGTGLEEFRETVVKLLDLAPLPHLLDRDKNRKKQDDDEAPEFPAEFRIAIIGKPNVGKSSLLNRLLGEDRVLVSDMPGTTRDAIDVRLRYHGQDYRFVDTAGIRRRAKVHEFVEKISVIQAQKNIERSDVVLFLVDSSADPSLQDANISGYAHNHYKNVIVLFNKWDLVEKDTGTAKKLAQEMRQRMKFLKYAPVLFISAKTGQRVNRIFPKIRELLTTSSRKIPTAKLNKILEEVVTRHRPPAERGRPYRFYYMTQTGTLPITFTVFTNSIKEPHFSYQRYLENELRSAFELDEVPVKIIYKPRPKRNRPGKTGGR